jgi:hypothetical protein
MIYLEVALFIAISRLCDRRSVGGRSGGGNGHEGKSVGKKDLY